MDFTKIEDNFSKEPNLEDIWKIEAIRIKESPTISDDDKAISEFMRIHERYQECWPCREKIPDLPDNYNLAYGRLNYVAKRLRENPEMLMAYDVVIKDQLGKGVVQIDGNSI